MDKMNEVILATAGYDHKIHFWEPPSGECRSTLRFSDSQVGMPTCQPSTGGYLSCLCFGLVVSGKVLRHGVGVSEVLFLFYVSAAVSLKSFLPSCVSPVVFCTTRQTHTRLPPPSFPT